MASALSLLDSDPELGLALAVEAASVDPSPRAEDALRQTLGASRERAVFDIGHPLVGLELDRSGSNALVVGADGLARLIDLGTGHEAWSHRVDGAAAAFAPDGRTVHMAVGRSLIVVDAKTGRTRGEPVPLRVPGKVERLVVSPRGTSAIVVAGKPRARVVALATGERIGRVKQPPRGDRCCVRPVGSSRGELGYRPNRPPLGHPDVDRDGHTLRGHVGRVTVVSFDRSGERVATGSSDQTARVWRAGTGILVAVLYLHTG